MFQNFRMSGFAYFSHISQVWRFSPPYAAHGVAPQPLQPEAITGTGNLVRKNKQWFLVGKIMGKSSENGEIMGIYNGNTLEYTLGIH